MELYGPKKRGPKPKTFLLKVREEEEKIHVFCVADLLPEPTKGTLKGQHCYG